MKHYAAILLLLLAPLPAWGQGTRRVPVPPSVVDAEHALRCLRGEGITGNATKVNAAFTNANYRYGVHLPGGDWAITESIVLPFKSGPQLVGSGSSKDYGETHYDQIGDDFGGLGVSRIVWEGAADGTMVRADAINWTMRDLHLQGCRVAGGGSEPTGGVYPNRAQIGIKIRSSTEIGSESATTAKCVLDNLSFYQINTPILVGRDLVGTGSATYTGEDDNHGDTIFAGAIRCYFPYSGVHENSGTAIHIRNSQSVDNYVQQVVANGNPAQVVWVERGGKSHFGQISVVGDAEGTTTALRVGKVDVNQGGITVGQINIDALSTGAKLLKMDDPEATFPGPTIVIHSAFIPVTNNAVPQIDARAGKVMVYNAGCLDAGSIRMNGNSTRVCEVNLIGCVLDVSNPALLIDTANSASTGPYILRWRNCSLRHQASPVAWGRPIQDGKVESVNAGYSDEIVN